MNAAPGSLLESAVDMERLVRAASREGGLQAVILRLGMFYCHDSAQTRSLVNAARRGLMPIIGSGEAYWSLYPRGRRGRGGGGAVEEGV